MYLAFVEKIGHDNSKAGPVNKVIIEKSRGEVSLLEQDTFFLSFKKKKKITSFYATF